MWSASHLDLNRLRRFKPTATAKTTNRRRASSTTSRPTFAVTPRTAKTLAEEGQALLKRATKGRKLPPERRSASTPSSPLPTPVRRDLKIGNQRYVYHNEQIKHAARNALTRIINISRNIQSTLKGDHASQASETLWLHKINEKPILFIQACGFYSIGDINDSIFTNGGQVIPEHLLTPKGKLTEPTAAWLRSPQICRSPHFTEDSSATPIREKITSPKKSPVGHDSAITSLADASSATASGLNISADSSLPRTPSPRHSPASAASLPGTPAIARPKTPLSMSPKNPPAQVVTGVTGMPLAPPRASASLTTFPSTPQAIIHSPQDPNSQTERKRTPNSELRKIQRSITRRARLAFDSAPQAASRTPTTRSPSSQTERTAITRSYGNTASSSPPLATTLPTSATTSSPGAMLLSAALRRQTTTPAGGSPQHRSPMQEPVTSPLDDVKQILFHKPDCSRPAVITTSTEDLIHSSQTAYQDFIRAINKERLLIESSTLPETTEPADPAEIRRLQTQQQESYQLYCDTHGSSAHLSYKRMREIHKLPPISEETTLAPNLYQTPVRRQTRTAHPGVTRIRDTPEVFRRIALCAKSIASNKELMTKAQQRLTQLQELTTDGEEKDQAIRLLEDEIRRYEGIITQCNKKLRILENEATQRYQSTPTSHRSPATPGPASPATPAALRAISRLAAEISATQMALQEHEQLRAHDKAATARQLLEQLFLQLASAEEKAITTAPTPLPATPWSTALQIALPASPTRTP